MSFSYQSSPPNSNHTSNPNKESLEYHMKNISWHMKVISDNLAKLINMQLKKEEENQNKQLPF